MGHQWKINMPLPMRTKMASLGESRPKPIQRFINLDILYLDFFNAFNEKSYCKAAKKQYICHSFALSQVDCDSSL